MPHVQSSKEQFSQPKKKKKKSSKEQSSCFERYLNWEIVIAHTEMHTIVHTRRNRILHNKHNFSSNFEMVKSYLKNTISQSN